MFKRTLLSALRKYLTTSSGQLQPQSSILDLMGFLDLPSNTLKENQEKEIIFGKAEGLQFY